MTEYVIIGEDRFSQKHEWGRFTNLRDCYNRLNELKTGTAGDSVRFKVKEVRSMTADEMFQAMGFTKPDYRGGAIHYTYVSNRGVRVVSVTTEGDMAAGYIISPGGEIRKTGLDRGEIKAVAKLIEEMEAAQ